MRRYTYIIYTLLLTLLSLTPSWGRQSREVVVGAEREELYLPLLEGRRVAILSNHTGVVGGQHTLDRLLERGVDVVAIFSPEHGFRGVADAGAHVSNSRDEETGVEILSLYDGVSKRPSRESMERFDTLVVDIQDVGLRFYTYYISMLRMMDACAEVGYRVVIFDRPNPNGFYVDGPILDMELRSGVGALPIPVVHGMTMGELARMINGEGWLFEGGECELHVVPCLRYTHQTLYELPIAPSPNLPNMRSIYLYPSTCLFEGTPLSLGRGTDDPFQIYGHPDFEGGDISFTPRSRSGALSPPLQDRLCYGVDLRGISLERVRERGFDLSYVIDGYRRLNVGEEYFGAMFDLLVGQRYVREMIVEGVPIESIEAMWREDVEEFRRRRRPYLLYKE